MKCSQRVKQPSGSGLTRFRPEGMPVLAAQMLAEGHDARRSAGHSRRDDPRDIRQEFGQALEELGAWLPGRGAAEPAAGICRAHCSA